MAVPLKVADAYNASAKLTSTRSQESEIFRQVANALSSAREGGAIERARALSDNRRLWMATTAVVRDPNNVMQPALKAAILSVGMAVERAMAENNPDYDMLVTINQNIANGLLSGTVADASARSPGAVL